MIALISVSLLALILLIGVWSRLRHRHAPQATTESRVFRPRLGLDIHSSPLINPPQTAPLSSAYYLVLDTETFDAIDPSMEPIESEFASPLVALSWTLTDRSGRPIREHSLVIRQRGQMHEEAIAIHGISNEAMAQGTAPHIALDALYSDLSLAQVIVAHNARFHLSILRHEAEQCGYPIAPLTAKPYLCTMLWGKELGFKVNASGHPLYPNICELFVYLYYGILHLPIHYDSKTLRDTRLCGACLRKMQRG